MAGKKGFGSKMSYSIDGTLGTGTTFVDLAQVTTITPFAAKAAVIDISDHNSPSQFREKVSGMLDAGAAKVVLNYDDKNTVHKFLLANLGVAMTFKVTGSGSSPATATYAGFVTEVSPEYPFDNKMTCTVSMEITGVVTVA